MDNSSNFLTPIDTPGTSGNTVFSVPNTGMFKGSAVTLKRGQWYALVIERNLQKTPLYTLAVVGSDTNNASLNANVGGCSDSVVTGHSIYYKIVEIKGPKNIDGLLENQEVLQIFRVGDVKEVEKVYKDKITEVKTPTFRGYKINAKKKIKKLKKKTKKK